jgi:4-oxalocrotonate tautomerase
MRICGLGRALTDGCARPRHALACRHQHKEDQMPEVVFYALGGRSVEQKRALIKDFTDAVVKNYKVDPSAVTITIVESSKEDKAKGGVLFSDMAPAKS